MGPNKLVSPGRCKCQKCSGGFTSDSLNVPNFMEHFRYACEICGNKRCPHHQSHLFKCTNCNEVGQVGELDDNVIA